MFPASTDGLILSEEPTGTSTGQGRPYTDNFLSWEDSIGIDSGTFLIKAPLGIIHLIVRKKHFNLIVAFNLIV